LRENELLRGLELMISRVFHRWDLLSSISLLQHVTTYCDT